jgi:hypothetical protein
VLLSIGKKSLLTLVLRPLSFAFWLSTLWESAVKPKFYQSTLVGAKQIKLLSIFKSTPYDMENVEFVHFS